MAYRSGCRRGRRPRRRGRLDYAGCAAVARPRAAGRSGDSSPSHPRSPAQPPVPRSIASGICSAEHRSMPPSGAPPDRRRRRPCPDRLGRHQRGDLCGGACRLARHGVRAAVQHAARAVPAAGRPAGRGGEHRNAAADRTATASASSWRRGWSTAAAWSNWRRPAPTWPSAFASPAPRGCRPSSRGTARARSSAARSTICGCCASGLSAGVSAPAPHEGRGIRRSRPWPPPSPSPTWRSSRSRSCSASCSWPGPGCACLGFSASDSSARRPRTFSDDGLPIYSIIVALLSRGRGGERAGRLRCARSTTRRKSSTSSSCSSRTIATRSEALSRLQLGPPFEIIIAPRARPAHQAEGAQRRAAVRARQLRRGVRRRGPAGARPASPRARGVRRRRRAARLRAGAADHRQRRRQLADARVHRGICRPVRCVPAGLAAWHLPLPLGGSSNHFRTAVLRGSARWDPYNVTEDADLGMRLARFGYRTAVIPSTTYEEAPARFGPWLRQRTRWFKGWMQTWLVHMRSPRAPRARAWAVAALRCSSFWSAAPCWRRWSTCCSPRGLIWTLATDAGRRRDDAACCSASMPRRCCRGYLISAALGLIGLARRRLLGCAWALLLMPLYWLLLSLAAWRALFQLVRDPYRWEKTEHGLARTSRLGVRIKDSA